MMYFCRNSAEFTLSPDKILQISGYWKTPVFCEGVEKVHFPYPNFGS